MSRFRVRQEEEDWDSLPPIPTPMNIPSLLSPSSSSDSEPSKSIKTKKSHKQKSTKPKDEEVNASFKPFNGVMLPQHYDNIKEIFDDYCKRKRFEYICLKIFADEVVESALENGISSLEESFNWKAEILRDKGKDWSASVIGILPDIGHQMGSSNPKLRKNAESIWDLVLNHGYYLGIVNYIVDTELNPHLTRALCASLKDKDTAQCLKKFHLRLRLFSTEPGHPKVEGLWEKWRGIHQMLKFRCEVLVALDFSYYQPGTLSDFELKRWLAEPVSFILISEESFVDLNGTFIFPDHIKRIFIDFVGHHASPVVVLTNPKFRCQLLYKLCMDNAKKEVAETEKYSRFQDNDFKVTSLNEPLQPLAHNICPITYNIFLQDNIKYKLYKNAIEKALRDIISKWTKSGEKIVGVVAGAGKDGPLVSCLTDSAKELGILSRLKVYAVEKNILAFNCLTQTKNPDWENTVTFIGSDVRTWNFPEKVHLIISELLGSFGDNELSPECLCTLHENLKDGGIMIPQSYTSFLQPISNPRLYSFNSYVKPTLSTRERQKTLEMGWLTLLDRTLPLADPQETFQFSHPPHEQDTGGAVADRFKELNFKMEGDAVLHAFAGFFETLLYDDIWISTHPQRKTQTLSSWDPIYFQLMEPINVKSGDKVTLLFWRKSNASSVWYQWALTSPQPTHIHNLNGRFQKLDKCCS